MSIVHSEIGKYTSGEYHPVFTIGSFLKRIFGLYINCLTE